MSGKKILFSANDGTNGYQLWSTDGTSAGTYLVFDINPGGGNSSPADITALGNGTAVFEAKNGTGVYQLWVTNGTAAGTSLVKDISLPSVGSSQPSPYFTPLGAGEAVFSANDGSDGTELWVTNGTSAGTYLVKDINPGSGGSYPHDITALGNGEALFAASDGSNGPQLWVTNGTLAGTMAVTNLNPGSIGSNPTDITALGNGTAVFSANDGTHGYELWVTNGTSAGTSLVQDIDPGIESSYPTDITSLGNGKALFQADDGTNGAELWVTNGTLAGTYLVKDIYPGSGSSYPHDITALGNGEALFSANDGSDGYELWVTNGTSAGTSLVKDIYPGSTGSKPTDITSLGNGEALFAANDGIHGDELWVTDGTSAGTSLVQDINPGQASSNPTDITAIGGGMALFNATDGTGGTELWMTDGTSAGTSLVQGAAPTAIASDPSGLAPLIGPYGVDLTTGGTVTNPAGAVIEGTVAGVLITGGPGTVINAGTINGGGTDAVTLAAGFANRVILDPGATFTGLVDGGNTIGASASSTLELTSAQGTLTGFGAGFLNFAQIFVDPGASWAMNGGSLAPGVTLTDQGQLLLSGTTVTGGAVTLATTAGVTASGTVTEGTWSGMGPLVVGNAGSGAFLIDAAGTVDTGGVDLASTATGSGAITVSGTKSLLSNTGTFLIGDQGVGNLSINAGGTVTTSAGAMIANTASASGSSVSITGTGANWQVAGTLTDGAAGSGSLSINAGGAVTAHALALGSATTGDGELSVVGSGSTLDVTGSAIAGVDGTGVFDVLGGATVSASSLDIGDAAGSAGALFVSGIGSVLDVTGVLNIGSTTGGTGAVTVGAGGDINAGEVIYNGRALLEGGTIDPVLQIIKKNNPVGGFGGLTGDTIIDEGNVFAGDNQPGENLLVVSGTIVGGGTWTENGTAQTAASGKVGVLEISSNGTMELTGAVLNAATYTVTDNLVPANTYAVTNSAIDVVFDDGTGTLQLDDAAQFAGMIDLNGGNFYSGDAIVITGGTLSNLGVTNGDTLTVSDAGTGGVDQIIFNAAILKSQFVIANGNTVTYAPCFAAGTRIGTPDGLVAVENLRAGASVVTHLGVARVIRWIGHRQIDLTRHANPQRVIPVRIRAGAIGDGLPGRDLLLSPDHALLIDGMLIPAKLLLNGASIVSEATARHVTYYHVELDGHDILLAESVPAESYLDTGNRDMFENTVSPRRLHPDFAGGQQQREALSCAPFTTEPDLVEPVWRHLASRAELLGWQLPRPPDLTDEPNLEIQIGTLLLKPVVKVNGRYVFVVPPASETLRLVSRAALPHDARPWADDPRRLGVMIRRLTWRDEQDVRAIAMDDPVLEQGWWEVESQGGWPCRWTNGDAVLPSLGAGVLEVEVNGSIQYPIDPAAGRDWPPSFLAAVVGE